MRKAFFMMLLAVVSGNAAAEWVLVGIGEDETVTSYSDPATIRRSGNLVKMWDMDDYKTAQGLDISKPYMSVKTQTEYDCKEERRRLLYASRHSKNMGNGDVMSANTSPQEWRPIPPGTLAQSAWKFACGKK